MLRWTGALDFKLTTALRRFELYAVVTSALYQVAQEQSVEPRCIVNVEYLWHQASSLIEAPQAILNWPSGG